MLHNSQSSNANSVVTRRPTEGMEFPRLDLRLPFLGQAAQIPPSPPRKRSFNRWNYNFDLQIAESSSSPLPPG